MADKEEEKVETPKPEALSKDETKTNGHHHIHKSGLAIALLVGLIFLTMVVFGALIGGQMFVRRAEVRTDLRSEFRNNMPMMRSGGGYGIRNRNDISGKVTAVSDKKFTIDASGTTYDVQISDTTRFPIASATSVKVGDTVQVVGAKDSSGVIQATAVVVNP